MPFYFSKVRRKYELIGQLLQVGGEGGGGVQVTPPPNLPLISAIIIILTVIDLVS